MVMKKGIIILVAFLVLILGLHIYNGILTDRYAQKQSIALCEWLNSEDSSKSEPKVGPQALKKLFLIKADKSIRFKCSVEKSPYDYGYKNQQSIIIYQKDVALMGLVYGFSLSGRNFLKSRYYQYWTP